MTNSRSKGKRGELELVHWLAERGFPARRGQQFRGGGGAADVTAEDGSPALPGVHVEVKRTETLRLWDALEQARRDARPEEVPVVFHRPNRRGWVVVLDAEHYVALLATQQRRA